MDRSAKMKKRLRAVQFMTLDAFSIALTYGATVFIFHALDITIDYRNILMILPVIVVLKIVFFVAFGLYRMLLDHFGFEDAFKIFSVVLISNVFLSFFFGFSGIDFVSWQAFVFIAPLEMVLLTLPRVAKRAVNFLRTNMDWRQALGVRTLIIGAGDGGEMVLKEIYRNKAMPNIPVAFVDDDGDKIGSRLSGIRILGPIKQVPEFIEEYRIEEVIIAIKNINFKKLQDMLRMFTEQHVRIKRLPLMEEVKGNGATKIIDVHVEDLMNRDIVELDNKEMKNMVKGKTVLVTGGGGSIGSELSRQIVELRPAKLVIFDIYENNAYDVQQEIERRCRKQKRTGCLDVIIGSVYNDQRLESVYKQYQFNLVFHAAAYKHVPLMETSPHEAIRTNVIGTYYAAKLADKYKADHFVLVSSDKAVRPTNVMGATKRYAELIVQHFANQSEQTTYSAVRFGNVLGSNGSVIPLFKKQIEEGGPVTVTHPEITRFFMTIRESVALILQSAVYAKGGEIFVLDMGEPVKIKDLAEKMIRLAGYKPYKDIDVEYTGLRPGEKLFEELLIDVDNNIKTPNRKIFIEHAAGNGESRFDEATFTDIMERFESLGVLDVKAQLKRIIKSYHTHHGH